MVLLEIIVVATIGEKFAFLPAVRAVCRQCCHAAFCVFPTGRVCRDDWSVRVLQRSENHVTSALHSRYAMAR